MIKAFMTGNLVRDPETKTIPNGTNLTTFTVAVNGRTKDDTQYIRVTTWRQLAENCNRYLSKGKKVAVVGSISLNTYKKQNGDTGASLEMNADEVEFLSPRNEPQAAPQIDEQSGMTIVNDADLLPF